MLEHLQAVERQTGVTPQVLLDAPALPQGCEELWRAFNELHTCRAIGSGAPQRITYTEMDAFQRVSGIRFHQWEIEAIRRADRAFLDDWAERQARRD